MAIQNRKKIWRKFKKTLCPAPTNNEVIPMDQLAVINVQENNFVANEAEAHPTEAKEVLSVLTITLSITGRCINLVLLSLTGAGTDTVVLMGMLTLLIMAITHIAWVVISQKLRQFTMELIAILRN